jgi:hypothetical protein
MNMTVEEQYNEAIAKQNKVYKTKLQYMGEKGKCKAELRVALEMFEENPWTGNWHQLMNSMARYQNIVKNCTYKQEE